MGRRRRPASSRSSSMKTYSGLGLQGGKVGRRTSSRTQTRRTTPAQTRLTCAARYSRCGMIGATTRRLRSRSTTSSRGALRSSARRRGPGATFARRRLRVTSSTQRTLRSMLRHRGRISTASSNHTMGTSFTNSPGPSARSAQISRPSVRRTRSSSASSRTRGRPVRGCSSPDLIPGCMSRI